MTGKYAILLSCLIVANLFSQSLQQYWRNDNKIKNWPSMPAFGGASASSYNSAPSIISANTNRGFGSVQSNLPSSGSYGNAFGSAQSAEYPYGSSSSGQNGGGYPSNTNGFGSIFSNPSSSQNAFPSYQSSYGSQGSYIPQQQPAAAASNPYGAGSFGSSAGSSSFGSSGSYNVPSYGSSNGYGSSSGSSNGYGSSSSEYLPSSSQGGNSNYNFGGSSSGASSSGIQSILPLQPLPSLPSQSQQPSQQQQQQQASGSGSSGSDETLLNGIQFDCQSRPTGHWRDTRYCDVFHACVFGQQKKTYSCPQVGERSYYDEGLKRCEFVHKNPSACQSGSYLH